jgi:hypothetical protein
MQRVHKTCTGHRNRYHPKGGKHIYCFYAAPNVVKPTLEKAWHSYIDYGEELLQTRVTRTNTLQLSTAIPSEADLAHTRKRKKPHGKIEIDLSIEKLPLNAPLPAASLPAIQTSYWHSSEARRLFRPLATEKDVVEGIDNQIELLRTASSTPHGYLTLIERG